MRTLNLFKKIAGPREEKRAENGREDINAPPGILNWVKILPAESSKIDKDIYNRVKNMFSGIIVKKVVLIFGIHNFSGFLVFS